MFTGLIREIGRLRTVRPAGGVLAVDIEAAQLAATATVGDSIAVNGICLTVTRLAGSVFTVEAAAETRRLTTLGAWRRGQKLHLEGALRAGDALDGHFVQGHVDGVGEVLKVRQVSRDWLVTIGLPGDLARFLIPKGSVAVDGVSLTVDAGPHTDRFTVNLIPHSLDGTNFRALRTGQNVNLEMDVLVKAVRTGQPLAGLGEAIPRATTEKKSPGRTLEQLLAKGFGRPRPRGGK